ncbi:hypothetical protein [Thiobacter aerophilum]|uniref:Uncharacterized protein n=1 Tax=Thiobacter aerophilum TaxID=3121275 RepID=A0ABV0EI88_9BURK
MLSTHLKAAIAFFAWILLALVVGFLSRQAITRLLGPDIWPWAALWAGSILGLINVLLVRILARR